MVPGTGRTRMASKVCFCLGILGFSPEFFFFFLTYALKKSITDVHIINNGPGSIPSTRPKN